MSTPEWKHISESVLKHNRCCGCGLCVGVCPGNALEMRLGENGQYKPHLAKTCTHCGLCARICPSVCHDKKADELSFAQEHGYTASSVEENLRFYRSTWVGAAADPFRSVGSSGGIVTGLCHSALSLRLYDACAVVIPNRNPGPPRFMTTLVEDPDDVYMAAGSRYYPVEFSRVLRSIQRRNLRTLIVCLPCVAYGLHRLKTILPQYKDQLFILSLACGHCPSALFTEFLLTPEERNAGRINYRDHSCRDPYSRYSFSVRTDNSSRKIPFQGMYGLAYTSWFFGVNACRYCDDALGDFADLCVMDAWLPEYVSDTRGTSLLLLRTDRAESLVSSAAAADVLKVKAIPSRKVANAQKGVLLNKNEVLSGLLCFASRPVSTRRARDPRNAIRFIRRLVSMYLGCNWAPFLRRVGLSGWALMLVSGVHPTRVLRLMAKSMLRGEQH